ncbi:RagB/SusD family nutrient uptake outer membrane protein [Dysgonomonas sp. Marseille-P4677]|uniref:RagB/SusD family nutrient uptake outer membrane protein n=1 Tax=Dysgonomonas sp. Marseille-P4677 TaxID=2364790 RepID=UPI001911A56C|nr:RagB/SusD family nutrient uptake outer membrane protein [Dysgonomonas sp. Marseille-P4677]MBK5722825.1 RagB/SusD family nutrient uptake outer membrane protein [Dysgonomonas sp. Marseille-P4677]
MKKIIKFSLIAISILIFSGCSDFLDLKPEGNLGTTGTFYRNTKDIEYALTASYADLQSKAMYREYMVLMTDVRSDDLGSFANSGANAGREYSIKIFTAQSDNQIFREVWASTYETIYRCNNVVKYIDVVNDNDLKKQYEAEAKFIRALCYFNIVRFWGDAPLILEPLSTQEVAQCSRDAATSIYGAIEADLKFASDAGNLPTSFKGEQLGRATSLAAKALLGKVYLQQKKWNDAKTVLGELINIDNAAIHGLLPDIANVFSTAPAPGSSNADYNNYNGWSPQTMNKEILFQVLFNKDISGEGRNALTYYTSQADLNEAFKLSNPIECIYNPADRRADLMRSIKGTNSDNKLIVKYADIESSIKQYGYHTPVLRWADVLLMYAEALNEVAYDGSATSPALKALNEVRTRSLANGSYTIDKLSNQDSFRKAVFLERRLEFPMEMQRWFDLIRSGDAISAIGKIGYNIDSHDFLYPVPYSEVSLRNDANKFPQNPGY